MSYDIAKPNRLKGKFNFNLKDWRFELDGIEDEDTYQVARKNPRKRPPAIWKRRHDLDKVHWDEADN